MPKTILVLGGCGGTGRVLCKRLLDETDVDVIVAGRRADQAKALADALNHDVGGQRASAVFADASNRLSLVAAFAGVAMVVDATNAIPDVVAIAEETLSAGADFLDFHFEQRVPALLRDLEPSIRASGRCFITQAGFHPGLPAAFIRHAASSLHSCWTATIGMAMNQPIEKAESIYELVDMVADYKAEVFDNGAWRTAGVSEVKTFDFGARFGIRRCYPLQLEEMRAMPDMLGLKETGVYVAGFNGFVDNVVIPLAMLLFKIKPGLGRKAIAELMLWGMNTFAGSRRGVTFVLQAEGEQAGRTVRIRIVAEHDDVYAFTAIPVVACIRQYLDGAIARPGLWMMGHVVQPDRLIADMTRMGVAVRTEIC
jgi:saccharopine dehydrogenase-like NADP-dependent oxidoreductase